MLAQLAAFEIEVAAAQLRRRMSNAAAVVVRPARGRRDVDGWDVRCDDAPPAAGATEPTSQAARGGAVSERRTPGREMTTEEHRAIINDPDASEATKRLARAALKRLLGRDDGESLPSRFDTVVTTTSERQNPCNRESERQGSAAYAPSSVPSSTFDLGWGVL